MNTDSRPKTIGDLAREFRRVDEEIRRARRNVFPYGSAVQVNHPRYHGTGIVESDHECPPDKLPVLIESGNVWFYEVETCAPMPAVKAPRWLRRIILSRKLSGIKRPALGMSWDKKPTVV